MSTDKNLSGVKLFPDSKQGNEIYILLANLQEQQLNVRPVDADQVADRGSFFGSTNNVRKDSFPTQNKQLPRFSRLGIFRWLLS